MYMYTTCTSFLIYKTMNDYYQNTATIIILISVNKTFNQTSDPSLATSAKLPLLRELLNGPFCGYWRS